MNPEFRRNVWLELTPRRVLLMVVVLGLAFFAAALSGGTDYRPAWVAEMAYYFIVVLWGSRNAALSVVGEIRDRTWDGQRLSSLSAVAMTWGKLFGATIYNWFGGAICLAVIAASEFVHQGPFVAGLDVVYFVALGLISQAVSLLASLVAVRRRQSHTRFGIFLYQIAGIVAACAVFYLWKAADPAGSFITRKPASDFVEWWGQRLDARPFFLVTLALFTGWTLIGCYREMRVELKMRNGPLVWAAFLVFMGVYAAGFDAWLPHTTMNIGWGAVALRLALAGGTYAYLSYVMVLLEPKDRVLYRWLGGEFGQGRVGSFLLGLQGWMMSYFSTLVVAVALIVLLFRANQLGDAALIATALAFLTRDIGIFILFQTFPGRRRGDFAAVAVIFALYALIPAILAGLGLKEAVAFFLPQTDRSDLAGALGCLGRGNRGGGSRVWPGRAQRETADSLEAARQRLFQARIIRLVDGDLVPRGRFEMGCEPRRLEREFVRADARTQFAIQVFKRAVVPEQCHETFRFFFRRMTVEFQLPRHDAERIRGDTRVKCGVTLELGHRLCFEEIAHHRHEFADRRLVHHGSELSMDDEIDEIDFGFRRTPADRRALDGMVVEKTLIHRHAHDAPFERAIDDPGPRLVGIDAAASRLFIALQQIRQVAEPAYDFLRDAKAPGIGADPADVFERIADMGQFPVECCFHAFG